MRRGYASVVLPAVRNRAEKGREESKGHLRRHHTLTLEGALPEKCNEKKAASMEIPWCKRNSMRPRSDVLGHLLS